MADLLASTPPSTKHHTISKSPHFYFFKPRRTVGFAYVCVFAFLGCMSFLLLHPSMYYSSPWFKNFLRTSVHSFFSSPHPPRPPPSHPFSYRSGVAILKNHSEKTQYSLSPPSDDTMQGNSTREVNSTSNGVDEIKLQNSTTQEQVFAKVKRVEGNRNFSTKYNGVDGSFRLKAPSPVLGNGIDKGGSSEQTRLHSNVTSHPKANDGAKTNYMSSIESQRGRNRSKTLNECDVYDGMWVRDNSYPLFERGTCPYIDEPFNCFLNGRPEFGYERYKWVPKDCNIPRLNSTHMLEILRGKRLVFVGDSLNRNMWESLVCVLQNTVKDKSKVFEASGSEEFRTEGYYSFIFKDYNCSVEFFQTPFLVQEWVMPTANGSKKETLRLDLIERSSDKYKTAEVIIFNTGHWWTHEKTLTGKEYYQEGSHVFDQLHVSKAFRKAMKTWARWVDANINPHKTLVFFRGYSPSHFSGGRWNTGGECDKEKDPIQNESRLEEYTTKMRIVESVIRKMKTPIFYMNITRMTDFRIDAHPSIYREQNMTEEERRSRFQDCSHWCLPGVPDTWNEILYAHLLWNRTHPNNKSLSQLRAKHRRQKKKHKRRGHHLK